MIDPFADLKDKRMGELTPEQKDRAYEKWLRDQMGNNWPMKDVFEAMLRVIDRLRAQGEPKKTMNWDKPGYWLDKVLVSGEPISIFVKIPNEDGMNWATIEDHLIDAGIPLARRGLPRSFSVSRGRLTMTNDFNQNGFGSYNFTWQDKNG